MPVPLAESRLLSTVILRDLFFSHEKEKYIIRFHMWRDIPSLYEIQDFYFLFSLPWNPMAKK